MTDNTLSSQPAADPLAPPAFMTLEPPAAPVILEPAQASSMVKLDPKVVPELDQQVEKFVNDILALQVESDEFKGRTNDLHGLGEEAIAKSAASSNRMMERPVRAMKSGMMDDKKGVGKGLVDLRQKMDELNPKRFGNLMAPRKLLGLIPFGSRMEDYFDSYQSAEDHIAAILRNLAEGKDELIQDNAAIEQEKQNLWDAMQRLEQYAYIAKAVDAKMVVHAAGLEMSDPHKAKVIKEELLFAVRQRVTDLLTQLAVSVQGYLAMDIIRKTNLELIKGVNRASTTTIAALRTAVMTAQALGVQGMVLKQITALNETTADMIVATSELMREQSVAITTQAANPVVPVEKLQIAFDNTFATFDMIADFKIKALDSMQKSVEALTIQVDRAKKYTDRAHSETLKDVSTDIAPSSNIAHL